jgi:PleD family two-component response regulator
MSNLYEEIAESLNEDSKKVFKDVMSEFERRAIEQYNMLLKSDEPISREHLKNILVKIFNVTNPIEELFKRLDG